jgi:methionine synthase II (cobalamin-independent)
MDVAQQDIARSRILHKLQKLPITDKQLKEYDDQLIFAQHLITYLEQQIQDIKEQQKQIKQSDPIEWNELNDTIRRMYETIDEQKHIISKIMKKLNHN